MIKLIVLSVLLNGELTSMLTKVCTESITLEARRRGGKGDKGGKKRRKGGNGLR